MKGDAVCPCCRTTILTPYTISTWRGQDVCAYCVPELNSHDAEDARRNIGQMTRVTLTLTPREP